MRPPAARSLVALALATAGCVVESTPPPVTAGSGLVIDETSGKIALDPKIVPVAAADCPEGAVARRTADGWACAAVDTLAPEQVAVGASCRKGEVVARTQDGWACAPNVDAAKTPVVEACEEGEVVTRTADGWKCAPAVDQAKTPVVSNCVPGQYLRAGATGWECGALGGTIAGAFLGDLSGNVTGDLLGDVTGSLTGNVTGDVTGNLFGNVTGDVTGNLVGNVTGNLAGKVTGDVTGNLLGNVKGDLVGRVTGDVTGNVSGTAANVTGIVALANGGTGASSLAANGLPVVNAAGDAFSVLAAGAAGNVLTSDGTKWISSAPAATGTTTAALNLYVRTDGHNTSCNGLADAAASAAPNCAKATVESAVGAIPGLVRHPVVVRIAPGTYFTPGIGIHQVVAPGGSIRLEGTGTVAADTIITGIPSGSTERTTVNGVSVGTRGVELKRLKIMGFKSNAVVTDMATLTLTGVTATDSASGFLCIRHSLCSINAINAGEVQDFSGNTGVGILVVRSQLGAGAPLNVGKSDLGLISETSNVTTGALEADDNRIGVLASRYGYVYLNGLVTVTNNRGTGLLANEHGWLQARAGANISAKVYPVNAEYGAFVSLHAEGNDVTLDCNNTASRPARAYSGSQLHLNGVSGRAISSTGCGEGLLVSEMSLLRWNHAGSKTISVGSGNPVRADLLSLVRRQQTGSLAANEITTATGAYAD